MFKKFLLLSFWALATKETVMLDNKLDFHPPPDKVEQRKAWVDSVYNRLTLDEQIGQFFMLAAYTPAETYNMKSVIKLIHEGKAGGVIFFKGGATDQAFYTNALNDTSKVLPFVAIDGEWGLSMRLMNTIQYPKQLTLGAIQNDSLIYEMGKQIANQCQRIGLSINFAPAVDINTNPNNPVIGERSFGEDKYNVALKGLAYAQGMQDNGVLACAKHFPGHGDTDKDSHHELPAVVKGYSKIKAEELYPFEVLIKNGIGSVMVAHLNVPALDYTPKMAASLSHKITTRLLKDTMGFQGLVFSDALNMKGVSAAYPPGTVDSIAFMAGNDILVFSQDCEKGIEKIKSALLNGTISKNELQDRVKKVLSYKFDLGLHTHKKIELNSLDDDLNKDEYHALNQRLYDASMTYASNSNKLLPLLQTGDKKIASLSIKSKGLSEFQKRITNYAKVDLYNLVTDESVNDFKYFTDKLDEYDVVIVDLHSMVKSASKNYGISKYTVDFLKQLNSNTNLILTVFGSPYSLKNFEGISQILMAYEDNDYTQLSAVNAIFGAIPVTGTLPVTASGLFPAGTGEQQPLTYKIKLAKPFDGGYSKFDLGEIDDIVLKAILKKAMPGCQVLVLKDNQVVWNKSYGNMDYENGSKIEPYMIYDLASITKVAATTLAVMKLYESGDLDIYEKVSSYISLPDSNTIGEVRIHDILMHQAGLKAFIPFYQATLNENFMSYYRTQKTEEFNVEVAKGLFIRNDMPDSLWYMMARSEINSSPRYVYSDIDFYILQKIVEQITQKPLHLFVEETFYKPMGLTRTGFLPLRFSPLENIVPSENDTEFRKCILRGSVNDPGAAMCGGVAGHAGLFGNAFELAQIFQMLVNKGEYNGVAFFRPETVELFTDRQSKISRRGYGFDKPEPDKSKSNPCSDNTPLSVFGHTGFTGTCVWADPDNKLVYVFLSNRTYPDASNNLLVKMNVRSDIQNVIYKYLKK